MSKFIEFAKALQKQVDIGALVRETVGETWKHGRGFKCYSPLREKGQGPSFWVYEDTQSFVDWGTMAGGDIYAFVMQRDRVDFKTAVGIVAARANVTPYWVNSNQDPLDKEAMGYLERRVVEDMLSEAVDFYHAALPSKIRAEVLREGYGFTDETIDSLKIGWASMGGTSLTHYFLEEKGYSREACLKTGLFIEKGHGGEVVDFYQARIVFPYWYRSRVVYTIARRTEYSPDDDYERSKYKKQLVHSEKHSYVSKSVSNEWFWGEDAVAARVDELVITEGVTDAISAWQAKIPVVSPVTVRFRDKDLPKLLRLTERADRVVICNDADLLPDGRSPGEEGALKTATALFTAKRDVRIAALPRPAGATKIDLNEFLKRSGEVALRKVLDAGLRYPEHLIQQIPAAPALEPDDLEARLRPVAEVVSTTSEISRESYIRKIAKRFSLPKRTIAAMVSSFDPPEVLLTDEQQKAEAVKEAEKKITIDEERVRGRVLEDLAYYYTKSPAGAEEVISSFALHCKQRIILESGEQLCCDARLLSSGRTIESIIFPRSAWTSRRDFLRALPSPDMQWTGTDDNVQGVLRLVTQSEAPTRQGTTNLGYYESKDGPRWVWPGGAIAPGGFLEDPDVVYVNQGSSLAGRLEYSPVPRAELVELAREILPELLRLNAPEVILPILGWFFAAPFKPRLTRELGHFPILFIWGTFGSGKTSIIRDIFWPLAGVSGRTEPYSCTQTEFAMMKQFASTNSIPIVLDEFKPRDMGKIKTDKFLRLLRRAYGGEMEERGRADQGVNTYYIEAPCCAMGEALFDGDPALIERLVCVSPSKNYLDSTPGAVEAFHTLRMKPLARLAGPFLQWTLSRDVSEDVVKARASTDDLLIRIDRKGTIPPRVYDNLVTMIFGLLEFDAWAGELGIAMPEVDTVSAFKALTKNILEGEGAQVKDAFDGFLEALSTFAHRGLLKEGTHYAMVNGILSIHLPSCHDVYLEERRKTGREDDTNGPRALKRVAKEKLERGSYITGVDKRVSLGDGLVRCVEIDPTKVPTDLDFEVFPVSKQRSWGGHRQDGTNGWGWGDRGGDA